MNSLEVASCQDLCLFECDLCGNFFRRHSSNICDLGFVHKGCFLDVDVLSLKTIDVCELPTEERTKIGVLSELSWMNAICFAGTFLNDTGVVTTCSLFTKGVL